MPKKKKDKGVFVQTRVPTPVVEFLRSKLKRTQISLAAHVRRLILEDVEKHDGSKEVLEKIGWP